MVDIRAGTFEKDLDGMPSKPLEMLSPGIAVLQNPKIIERCKITAIKSDAVGGK